MLVDLGVHSGSNRRGQSRASSTPMWRLGVQCEGSVRDPIRLAALVLVNLVARPGHLGMEAGAPDALPGINQSCGGSRKKNSGSKSPGSG